MAREIFISVDVEASGAVPGEFSMLSFGACLVNDTDKNFYIELKPITKNFNSAALKVAGFDLEQLARDGIEPAQAMQEFEAWLTEVTPADGTPIFVAYPLAFDWMFVAYYFQRFLGRNPFGYSGLDLKSFYMGMSGASWYDADEFPPERLFDSKAVLTHNARDDAIGQAKIFARLLEVGDKHRQTRTQIAKQT